MTTSKATGAAPEFHNGGSGGAERVRGAKVIASHGSPAQKTSVWGRIRCICELRPGLATQGDEGQEEGMKGTGG